MGRGEEKGIQDTIDAYRAASRFIAEAAPDTIDAPQRHVRGLVSHLSGRGRVVELFPRRKYADRNPTDIALLQSLAEIAKERLDTVLIGNV